MYKLLIIFSFLLPLFAAGQNNFSPCTDETAFRINYKEMSAKINTLKADFLQEKSISMLKDKLVSHGSFYFKKDSKVRMEFTQPFKYLFILNGNKIFITDSQNKKTQTNAGSSKIFRKINQLISGTINGALLSGNDFDSRIFENNRQYLLELKPNIKEIREFFSQFKIYIDKQTYQVEKMEMIELSGDKTTITYSNRLLNIPLNDSLFTVN